MLRKVLCFLCFTALCLSVFSAEPNKSGLPVFSPPPIVFQVKTEKLQVAQTGEFSSLPAHSSRKTAQRRSGSAVSLVSEEGKIFFWKPSPLLSSTIRTADLTGAALSSDGTLLVIAERIGGVDKANSTRLIFFDIETKKICGGFTIPEILISGIRFVPGSQTQLTGIKSAFEPFKVKAGIVKIDLKSKKITHSCDIQQGTVEAFAFGKEKLFFTTSGSNLVNILPLNDFSAVPQQFKSRISGGKILFAGNTILLFGPEGVEIFRMDSGRWIPDEKLFRGPEGFVPESGIVIDHQMLALCLLEKHGGTLCYFSGNAIREIKNRISGLAVWDHTRRILFTELAANNRIAIIQMPAGSEEFKPATPNRLKPANRNGTLALLRVPAMKDKMLQIDNRGNVFLLDYTRLNRWKKETVHIADRSGLR